MSAYEFLRTDVSAGIATIWLNRPERRNAFNALMTAELRHALVAFDAAADIRVIVVTGTGRYFSVGADLERGAETFNRPVEQEKSQPTQEQTVHPWEMRTPIIAAMNGSAVGMGMTLPMSWDIRLAAEDATYGFVFTRRGVVPEAGSTWIVPRLVGLSRALEVLLTGRLMSGREAAALGLVSRALPEDQVLSAAQELAQEIAANTSAMAVAATKALVYRALVEPDLHAHHALEHQVFRWAGRQDDAAEGVVAFLEKRAPRWRLSKTDLPPQLRTRPRSSDQPGADAPIPEAVTRGG